MAPKFLRRPGAVGVALTLFDLWRKLPPDQRKKAMELARKHGPTVAKQAAKLRKAR